MADCQWIFDPSSQTMTFSLNSPEKTRMLSQPDIDCTLSANAFQVDLYTPVNAVYFFRLRYQDSLTDILCIQPTSTGAFSPSVLTDRFTVDRESVSMPEIEIPSSSPSSSPTLRRLFRPTPPLIRKAPGVLPLLRPVPPARQKASAIPKP